ncbi:MAG: PAS domain-containing protein [Prolixibacteraceae bacterium]|nr:PAS domain-containing protein [Prolixibacteraceae bacterium]
MLKAITTTIVNRYHIEAQNDILKIIGLHVFILLGIFTGLIMFIRDLAGISTDICLPGDISILVIFGIALYVLRYVRISWAVQLFFLVPFIPYFFFISHTTSILPNHLSVPNTLWTLVPFLLFFLLFSENKRDLIIFFALAFLTLGLHVYLVGLTDLLFSFKWEVESVYINPFLTLSSFFLVSLLIALNFQNRINKLIEEKENTDRIINQTIRNLPQGMLVLELVPDEFGTPSHLVIRKTNLAFERLFKITSREIKDQKADDVFPKIFRNSFDWNKQYLSSKKRHFSFYLDRMDKHYEADSFNLTDNQIVSLFSDVTVKQNAIIELQENKLRYQVLLEAIPDLFFIIDRDGVYVDFVFKASDALKIKPDDIIGNSIFEVGFSEKMSAKILQCIQSCIDNDTIETIEYALELEGSSAMFEMRIVRLSDHTVISLARDISKRKLAEIRLEEAKNKAEEADRLKTAFLANISHEIRTPMNAIIGFSKMIGSAEFDDEEKSKFVEIIITNGKVLLTLINDMISLSKIESNTLVVKTAPCRINDLMVSLYKEFGYDLEDHKNIALKVNCDNSNPKFAVTTDPVLLQSVLQKLIDNGIKFTEEGEVEFGYRVLPNKLEFFVRDTGIGIAERDQERIFERFHQLDNRTIRAYEGTGLGLSIAQHYVRLIGGSLNVNSKLGKGSTFTFTIPNIKEDSPLKIVR